MHKTKILIQLDGDPQPSVFDAVVAVDSEVDHLFRHGGVAPEGVRELVYGAIFTRGPDDLKNTAIFIGGSDVGAGEALLQAVADTFMGPMRVSVMLDANGANTTAAAAVLAVLRHVEVEQANVAVLGSTGPVGQRVVRLLARLGASVRAGSRSVSRAKAACQAVAEHVPGARLTPCSTSSSEETAAALQGADVVVAAGALGVELLSTDVRSACHNLKLAVDLNAVPPAGIAGVEPHDKAAQRDGLICYGALGVGGTKVKIHKAAVRQLFQANDQVFDAEEILELGRAIA